MSAVGARTYTPADLLAMPDSNSIELVNGELVEKPVSVLSSLVEGMTYRKLGDFCDANKMAVVLPATSGIQCFPDKPQKVRKPDISVVKLNRFNSEHLHEGFLSIAPDLTVEVVSSHDEVPELNEKVEEYLAAGVPLVWVIDPLNEIAYVHRNDGSVTKLRKDDCLSGEDILPGFSCRLRDLLPTFAS